MKIIICLDDNNGILFNKRRQSSDSVLIRRIIELVNGSKLWMNSYSAKLFSDYPVSVAEDFLEHAGASEYAFVEDASLLPYMERVDQIIIYRWNRRYPSDVKFPPLGDEWQIVSTEEFEGNSHPILTEEVYER